LKGELFIYIFALNELEENKKIRRKIEQYQSQVSESDKIIRELRAREEDMTESLRSKDSQLAILRVRFDEVDGELNSKRAELNSLKNESERFLIQNLFSFFFHLN